MTKKRLLMMTRKTSHVRSAIKKSAVVPIIITICLVFGCQMTAQERPHENPVIRIGIESPDRIKLDNREVPLSLLDKRLAELSLNPDLTVELHVQPEAWFGTIVDVQKLLRTHEMLRINYSYDHTPE